MGVAHLEKHSAHSSRTDASTKLQLGLLTHANEAPRDSPKKPEHQLSASRQRLQALKDVGFLRDFEWNTEEEQDASGRSAEDDFWTEEEDNDAVSAARAPPYDPFRR